MIFVVVFSQTNQISFKNKKKHSLGMKLAPRRDKLHFSDLLYIYIYVYMVFNQVYPTF